MPELDDRKQAGRICARGLPDGFSALYQHAKLKTSTTRIAGAAQ